MELFKVVSKTVQNGDHLEHEAVLIVIKSDLRRLLRDARRMVRSRNVGRTGKRQFAQEAVAVRDGALASLFELPAVEMCRAPWFVLLIIMKIEV